MLLVGLSAWWAAAGIAPPNAVPASAPADAFSAERARIHQADISTKPHPAGSVEAGRVRQHIIDALARDGIESRVQDAVGTTGEDGASSVAYAKNVIAKIPGTRSTGTLFLAAHSDAAPASHGAGDDGAGVSTLLETARALVHGPRLRNDVVLVFTDAEEPGLLGAEAFVSQAPEAKAGGVVLNVEARGSRGPSLLFQTGPGNERLVDLFGANAPNPVGTSLAADLYKEMPNDTDFTPMLESGRFTGLNFSYLDGSAVYHAPQDDIEHQSIESLQHHGSNTLAAARAIGAADLAELAKPARDDATFFPVLGQLVRYPGALVWPIAIAAVAAVLGAAFLLVRRRVVGLGRLVASIGLVAIPVGVVLPAGTGLWALMTGIEPAYAQLEESWNPGWFRTALVLAVFAATLIWLALLRRRFPVEGLLLGGAVWLAGIGVFFAATVPGGSYVAAIPALATGVALIVAAFVRRRILAFTASGIVAVLVLVPTVGLLLPSAGISGSMPALFFTGLLALSLLPVLDLLFPQAVAPGTAPTARSLRWTGALLAPIAATVATAIAIGMGFATDRFDARDPIPVALSHVEDADTGRAHWVSTGNDPTGWSRSMVSERKDLSRDFPTLDPDTRIGAAPGTGAKGPEVSVRAERAVDGGREIDLRVASSRGARTLSIEPFEGTVRSAVVGGREVPGGSGFLVRIESLPAAGAEVTLRLAGTGPLRLRVVDGADGIERLPGFEPRPRGVGIMQGNDAEMSFVGRTVEL